MTGSVNQQGDIQPIGGVNEKIEGFFDACRVKGLYRAQGVMIPAENIEDLMLREDVIDAVALRTNFIVLPISTVEEGIEILTGVKAGSRDSNGSFEPDSVFGLADRRLHEMATTLKSFRRIVLDGRLRHALLLAVKETLNNVERHARATEVQFRLTFAEGQLHIIISDNGRGFDTNHTHAGKGLKNLPRRLSTLGGRYSIESSMGKGTIVTIGLRLPSRTEATAESALS